MGWKPGLRSFARAQERREARYTAGTDVTRKSVENTCRAAGYLVYFGYSLAAFSLLCTRRSFSAILSH